MSHLQSISTGFGNALLSMPIHHQALHHQALACNLDAAIMLIAPIIVGWMVWREYRNTVRTM